MAHHLSGRLHWDTTHAATPGWLLFLEERPGEAPTMLPEFETSLPHEASEADVARLIEDMLSRTTGGSRRYQQKIFGKGDSDEIIVGR